MSFLPRWSRRQCRRRELCQSDENIRTLLEGSQYLVRYLTLSLRDFSLCQNHTRLLSEDEARSVRFCLLYENGRLAPALAEHQAVLARKRFSKRELNFSLIKKSPVNVFNHEIPKTIMREIFMFLSSVLDWIKYINQVASKTEKDVTTVFISFNKTRRPIWASLLHHCCIQQIKLCMEDSHYGIL